MTLREWREDNMPHADWIFHGTRYECRLPEKPGRMIDLPFPECGFVIATTSLGGGEWLRASPEEVAFLLQLSAQEAEEAVISLAGGVPAAWQ